MVSYTECSQLRQQPAHGLQDQFDRVLVMEFGNAEGLGPNSRRTLIAEIMASALPADQRAGASPGSAPRLRAV